MSHPMRRRAQLAAGAAVLALAATAGLAGASDNHSHNGIRYSSWDQQWVTASIQGDRFEVIGGRLAATKGTTPQVRALGARLVKDHGKSLADAERLARRLGIDIPKTPTESQQWELRTVGSFTGIAFDRAYADLEVADHKQDIQEADDEVSDGSNRTVRHMAHDELPMLRAHLQLSRTALQTAAG